MPNWPEYTDMKLRNVLGAIAGSVGATALANRALVSRADDFAPFLDGDQGSYRWRGFDIAYAEYGDRETQDLLLFHGLNVAASGHEYWQVVDDLAEEYHVIVPDLPGFGHSDRPPLLYSASLYETFVRDAIEDLADEPTVVAAGLSGAYAGAAAEETAVDELVLITPTASTMSSERRVWLRALVRSPVVGEGLFNLAVSKPSIRHFNADHGYYDTDNLPDALLDYEWLTAHQEGARFAPASFVSGFLDPEQDLTDLLADVDVPVTLVWGRNAEVSSLSDGRELAESVDARLVVFDQAKLLPHAEHPGQFVDTIRGEVESTE